jgi:hypothetical protein
MRASDYERLIQDMISEFSRDFEPPGGLLISGGKNNKVAGASSFPHQIDVSLKTDRVLLLFECKYWAKPVGAEAVLVIASRQQDIHRANPGFKVEAGLVSSKPPTSGAQVLARYFGIHLDVVSTPREYAIRIRERFFIGRSDSLSGGLVDHATVVKRDCS